MIDRARQVTLALWCVALAGCRPSIGSGSAAQEFLCSPLTSWFGERPVLGVDVRYRGVAGVYVCGERVIRYMGNAETGAPIMETGTTSMSTDVPFDLACPSTQGVLLESGDSVKFVEEVSADLPATVTMGVEISYLVRGESKVRVFRTELEGIAISAKR